MKKNIFLVICINLFSMHCKNPQSPELWSDVGNGLRFRIWTDKMIYQEGEDIWLHVEFENVSSDEMVILVNGQQRQLPERAPLYDINKINIYPVENNATSSIFVLIPIPSNMFNDVPALFKLQPDKRYREGGIINLGGWTHKGLHEHDPFTQLEPGNYELQAIYSWAELPHPSQERITELEQLGAPLWNGYLESNEVTIIVTEN